MPSCIASGALLVRLRPANAPRAPQTNPKPRSGLAAVLEMAQADVAGVRAARGPLWDLAAEPAPRRHDRRRHPRRIPPRKKRDSLCFFHLHPESVDSLTDPFSLRPPPTVPTPLPPPNTRSTTAMSRTCTRCRALGGVRPPHRPGTRVSSDVSISAPQHIPSICLPSPFRWLPRPPRPRHSCPARRRPQLLAAPARVAALPGVAAPAGGDRLRP